MEGRQEKGRGRKEEETRAGGREERSHRGGKFVSKGVGDMLSVCAGTRKGVARSQGEIFFLFYLECDMHYLCLQFVTSCVTLLQ